jgi:hypothetical protein
MGLEFRGNFIRKGYEIKGVLKMEQKNRKLVEKSLRGFVMY